MKRFTIVLPCLLALAAPLAAAPADPAKSSFTFVSKQMGVPVEGRFHRFTAELHFDPAKPESSRAEVIIDTTSVDGGSRDATVEVRRPTWFDVARHPGARFISTAVRADGPGRYLAHGQMTIKGRSREVRVPFVARQQPGGWLFEGSLPIRRLEFSVGEGVWADTDTVADEIELRFRFFVPVKR